jgi:hypothetical protein
MNRSFALVLFVVIFVCFGGKRVEATQFVPLTIEQLAKKSNLVIHGTVLSKSTQRDPEGRIYTTVELQVMETWKGSITGDRFVLVHGGGVLGNQSSGAIGQESYDVGEEVVAFVVLNNRGQGVTLGLAQGKFHVWLDPESGTKEAHNLFHGRSAPPEGQLRSGSKRLSFSELKERVRAIGP